LGLALALLRSTVERGDLSLRLSAAKPVPGPL